MMKSRQSATRLRLSRLVRGLLFLGCLKLGIMGFALLDLPMPSWSGADTAENAAPVAAVEPVSPPLAQETASSTLPAPEPALTPEPLPSGSEAAILAAASKPRRDTALSPALPTPLVTAGPNSIIPAESQFIAPLPGTPAPLGAPLVAAGIILAPDKPADESVKEENIWDILNINSLPIPGLGSAQAAQAAVIDMPVPPAPPAASPFAPAEQVAPLNGSHITLPGAAPITPDMVRDINPDGTPLATRSYNSPYPSPDAAAPNDPPAPNIIPQQSNLNPAINSQDLARQQQDILMLRQQMDQRLNDLRSAEDKMKNMLDEAKDVEDKKVRALVQMYANMKPRNAALAMEKMDERIAVRILSGMAPKQSGEILTYTNPAKTAKFTEMLTRLRVHD